MILDALGQTSANWFCCLGRPLRGDELENARAYLRALGYPDDVPIRQVQDWAAAERIVRDPQWDRAWWEREQRERERLSLLTRGRLGTDAALDRLSAATDLAVNAIHDAALQAGASCGGASAALKQAASGAGAMALHEAALAQLAGCDHGHLFVRKYRLFESGRWPLGVVGGTFHLF